MVRWSRQLAVMFGVQLSEWDAWRGGAAMARAGFVDLMEVRSRGHVVLLDVFHFGAGKWPAGNEFFVEGLPRARTADEKKRGKNEAGCCLRSDRIFLYMQVITDLVEHQMLIAH
jgi:hypothetical protein